MPLEISENNPSPSHYLGVTEKLGLTIASEEDLATVVEEQLPIETLQSLEKGGLLDSEIYALIIPRRTLAHRRAKQERLSRDESDRAVRIARIASLAEDVFGSTEKAFHWLRKPKVRFKGRSPMIMLDTESGARLVEEMLYRIDYGMAA